MYEELFLRFGLSEFGLADVREAFREVGGGVYSHLRYLINSGKALRVGEGRYMLMHPVEVVCARALRRVALRFVESVKGMEGVLAVFLVGGVADGFGYRCSDVDLVVVVDDEKRAEDVYGVVHWPLDVEVLGLEDFRRELRRDYVLRSRILHSKVLLRRGDVQIPGSGLRGNIPVTDWLVEATVSSVGEADVHRFWDLLRKMVFCVAWFERVPATSVPLAMIRLSRKVNELRGLDVVLRKAMIEGGLDSRRHFGLLWKFVDFVWGRWARVLGVRRDFLFKLINGLR